MAITPEDLAQARAHLRGRHMTRSTAAKPVMHMQVLSTVLRAGWRKTHPRLTERIRAIAKQEHDLLAEGLIAKLVDNVCCMIVEMAGLTSDVKVTRSA